MRGDESKRVKGFCETSWRVCWCMCLCLCLSLSLALCVCRCVCEFFFFSLSDAKIHLGREERREEGGELRKTVKGEGMRVL